MRNIAFNKIGKIVAVASGIVLMGAVFSGCGFFDSMVGGSTSAQSSSSTSSTAKKKDSNIFSSLFGTDNNANRSKCNSNEIKTDTGIEKGVCKDGKRNGAWKYYDKDGYIQKEITWQNGEMTLQKEYDKNENLEFTTAYNKGEIVSKREYKQGKFEFFTHYYTEDNISIEREYYIYSLENITKEKTKQIKEKASEIAKQRAESKVKKPTMQEVAKSKGIMDSYRAKLKAQYEKELQIELAKNPELYKTPNFDTYSDSKLLSAVKDNNALGKEVITANDLRIVWGSPRITFYANINNNFTEVGSQGIEHWDKSCFEKKYTNKYNCRTFARQYKQLIDKSVFKDEIYKNLPKSKNQ